MYKRKLGFSELMGTVVHHRYINTSNHNKKLSITANYKLHENDWLTIDVSTEFSMWMLADELAIFKALFSL